MPDHLSTCGIGRLVVATASGMRGGGRSDRARMPWSGCCPLAWAFRRRWASTPCESRRDPRSRLTSPRLALPSSVPSASWFFGLPVPLLGPRGRKRARTPERSIRLGTRPPGRWGNADRGNCTGPAVKTSNPRLTPRGAGRAVGGIRTWAENSGRRASSESTVLLLRPLVWKHTQPSANIEGDDPGRVTHSQ